MSFVQLLRLIVRSWWRSKLFVVISLASLTVGIACTCLLTAFVLYERNVEAYNPNRERIFRLTQELPYNEQDMNTTFVFGGHAADVVAPFPEIESYACTYDTGEMPAYLRGEQYLLDNVLCVDSTFLQFFPFETLKGNLQEAIVRPEGLALSEETALRLFGTTDCVGQEMEVTLWGKDRAAVRVMAVYRQPPQGMVYADVLAPLTNRTNGNVCYILLREGTDVEAFQKRLSETRLPALSGEGNYRAVTLRESYLDTDTGESSSACVSHREPLLLTVGWLSAVLVLIVACFNYISLNFSRLLKQVYMLRVETLMGASLRQIRVQLFTDTFLLIGVAFVFSLLLMSDLMRLFNHVFSARLTFGYLFSPYVLPWLLGFVLLLAVIPSAYMSHKVHALSESSYRLFYVGRKRRYIVGALQIFQLAVSVGLLSAFMIIRGQLDLIARDAKRFEGVLELACDDPSLPPVGAWAEEVRRWPGVEAAVGSHCGIWGGSVALEIPETGVKGFLWLDLYPCTWDFLDFYRIKMADSEQVRRSAAGTAFPAVVNETFVRQLVSAGEDPTGHRVVDYTYRDFGMGTEWVIAGVVDDFRNRSLTDKITPAAFLLHDGIPSESHVLCVRLTDEKAAGKVLPRLRAKWEEIYPDKPFVYKDVEQMFVGMSGDVISFSRILLVYAVISLLLTLFGLFGIVRYAVRIRLREIGIRKIHGASVCRILWTLSRPFMVYLAVAFVVAFPVTLYGMGIWLEHFEYRVSVMPSHFLLPLLFVAAVTLLVVVGNGFRAAHANPVESIKRE